MLPSGNEFAPPCHLSAHSKALWGEIVPRRAKSAERLALLTVALESLDRAEESRAGIVASGLTAITKRSGVPHVNPLIKIERESRALFAKIWNQLDLNSTPDIDGRIDARLEKIMTGAD